MIIANSRPEHAGATGTKDSSGEVHGGSGKGNIEHRPNEDGSLPKALTEDVSKAVPHSQAQEDQVNAMKKDQH